MTPEELSTLTPEQLSEAQLHVGCAMLGFLVCCAVGIVLGIALFTETLIGVLK